MAKSKKTKFKQDRKLWYSGLKKIIKIRYKRPKFIYLGDKPNKNSIILSNHVGTDAPMSLELYADFPIRTWGTHEMNSGLSKMYRYQSRVYYHEKKRWNLHLARLFCLLASPLTNLFYKGFALLGQISLKHGIDPLIYTSYFKIKEKVYIFINRYYLVSLKK